MTLLSLVLFGLLTAYSGSLKAGSTARQTDSARALAEAQMEYVKNQPFSSSGYTPDPALLTAYPGYNVNISASPAQARDGNIQLITVAVTYPSSFSGQTVTTSLQDFKVN